LGKSTGGRDSVPGIISRGGLFGRGRTQRKKNVAGAVDSSPDSAIITNLLALACESWEVLFDNLAVIFLKPRLL
jgi:hypothetical protein